jgi:GAF domain-containing protein
MAEEIFIDAQLNKAQQYEQIIPQIAAIVGEEQNLIANLSNTMAVLRQVFGFFWVGVYLVDQNKTDELVLGPFQGTLACTRIKIGKGVCGAAWQQATTIIVPDVDQFPGHIACSAASKSEIVVPVFNKENEVIMVIDIDSDEYSAFDTTDQYYLEKIAVILAQCAQKSVN